MSEKPSASKTTDEMSDNIKLAAEIQENDLVTPSHDISEVKKLVGRPKRPMKIKKLSIELSEETHKALLHFKIDQGFYINDYIEKLLKANVPEKYFKPL